MHCLSFYYTELEFKKNILFYLFIIMNMYKMQYDIQSQDSIINQLFVLVKI